MSLGDADQDVLRFIVCGGDGAGKSTLIGRLLYDAEAIVDDGRDDPFTGGNRVGTIEDGVDFAHLVDRLGVEHRAGILTDVAYRRFSTRARSFLVTETADRDRDPRDMAAAASTARTAVMVVDAGAGIQPRTRRETVIAKIMGIQTVIVVVNKMDLVEFDHQAFETIAADYREFAGKLGIPTVLAIPVSALAGDNLARPGPQMAWYDGAPLLETLEAIEIGPAAVSQGFRLPVQRICGPDQGPKGYQGTVAAGAIRPGDDITVYPSGRPDRIETIQVDDSDSKEARAGDAVTVTLAGDTGIRLGDVIAAGPEPIVTDQFAANLLWLDMHPLIPERRYRLKLSASEVGAAVTELKFRYNVETLEHLAAKTIALNEVAFCNLALDRPIALVGYDADPNLGTFVLTDDVTKDTVGVGTIAFSLRRATNVPWQELEIGKAELAALKTQKPAIVWLTGLSGAGKSTIANMVQQRLHAMGRHTYLLDGDNLRHGLNRDLGFVEADRVENIRRVAEVAKLFLDSGTIVLVSLISPYRRDRLMARELIGEGEFIEVFVDTPLEICENRDPKGLYRKARAGQLINFTGIDAPYEPPERPEIRVYGGSDSADAAAEEIVEFLEKHQSEASNWRTTSIGGRR